MKVIFMRLNCYAGKSIFLLEQAWLTVEFTQHISGWKLLVPAASVVEEILESMKSNKRSLSKNTGEIEVVSIETGEQLWKLDGDSDPAAQPHFLLAGNDFLIFSKGVSNIIDVWRRSADCYEPGSYLPSRPTRAQLAQSPEAASAISFGYLPLDALDGSSTAPTPPAPTTNGLRASAQLPTGRRGVFLPFVQIAYHQQFRSCRYSHPYLAVVRESFPREGLSAVDIWHLPTLQRLARLCIDRDIGTVLDLAISPTPLYVSLWYRIVAYNWPSAMSDQSGEPVFLPAYPRFILPPDPTKQLPTFIWERFSAGGVPTSGSDALILQNFIPFGPPTDVKQMDLEPERSDMYTGPQFSRIAISPNGNDLVAIIRFRWVVYLPNFSSRDSASRRSDSKDSQMAFAFGIENEGEALAPSRTFPYITGLDTVVFDGFRMLLRGGNEMFAVVIKDRRYLEATDHSEPNTSPHFKPLFTICGFKQPNSSLAGHFNCINLRNGSVWFPAPCDGAPFELIFSRRVVERVGNADTKSRISYVDFTDFEGMTANIETNDAGVYENEGRSDSQVKPLDRYFEEPARRKFEPPGTGYRFTAELRRKSESAVNPTTRNFQILTAQLPPIHIPMHIHTLPVETLLHIIGYLPIQSICTLESVSQTFHNCRPAAPICASKRIGVRTLSSSQGRRGNSGPKKMVARNTWRGVGFMRLDLYAGKSSFLLEQAWSSLCRRDQPMYRRMKTLGVNRIRLDEDFKVDEVEQTVIIARDTGELEVLSIETEEQVWKFQGAPPPDQAIMTPPLLEFGKGFLIFSQVGSNLIDVWRRSADCYHPHSYLPSRPTNDQLARSPDAATAFSSGYLPIDGSSNEPTSPLTTCTLQTSAQLPRQGVFLPFTQIAYQEQFSKCCYTQPHLAVLRDSFPGQGLSVVDIWHLPTLQRSARLCIIDRDIGLVADIAVGPTYLYVAALQRIVAYKWISAITEASGEPVFLPAYPQFVMPRPHTNQLPTFLCERINRDDVQESGSHLVVYLPNFSRRDSENGKPDTKEGQIAFAFGIGRKAADIPRLRTLFHVTETIKHVAFDGHRILLRSHKGVYAVVVKNRRCLEAAHQLQPSALPQPKPPFTICGVERPNVYVLRPRTCMNLLNDSAWFTTAYIRTTSRICYIDFTDFGGGDVRVGANDSGMDEDEASDRGSAGDA
ncbi:hypothetical protein M407DRAFT_226498 [Tulasnella calospora MUT 4182]|uniref:F-box domain-containing protein n=1 Tax=Tulasnella calospora MUT 4182 TaxID=1051891 RepID=A0A0C3L982_9AGAM|nr:hypothetical protein M407DRAFT_226498 [Tulasnella calospora MUT 4182]